MAQAPLGALRAFEAAARHGSFSRAADELCVTQSAVSHQIGSVGRKGQESPLTLCMLGGLLRRPAAAGAVA